MVANAGRQGGEVAVGKVAASHPLGEEHVAAEDHRRGDAFCHEDDMPAGMARNFPDGEVEPGHEAACSRAPLGDDA